MAASDLKIIPFARIQRDYFAGEGEKRGLSLAQIIPFARTQRDYLPERGKERDLSLIIPLKGLFQNTRDIISSVLNYTKWAPLTILTMSLYPGHSTMLL